MADFNRQVDKFNELYSNYPVLFMRSAKFEAQKAGNAMQREAQRLGGFGSGGVGANMNRSIEAKVEVEGKSTKLTFWINPDFVTYPGKDGTPWNLTWIHNDGTGYSYGKGKLSPAVTPRLKSTGMKGKYFMDKAWDKEYPKLQKAISRIPERIVNKFLK